MTVQPVSPASPPALDDAMQFMESLRDSINQMRQCIAALEEGQSPHVIAPTLHHLGRRMMDLASALTSSADAGAVHCQTPLSEPSDSGALRRIVAPADSASIDLAPYAPRLGAFLANAGVRVRMLEMLDPEVERRLVMMGETIGTALTVNPLVRVILDSVKRALNPPPQRSRVLFHLRRLAGQSHERVAERLGIDPETLRGFERSGRGLTEEQIWSAQAWLGRLASGKDLHEAADLIGIDQETYCQFEATGRGLDPEQRNAWEAWLSTIVQRLGEASYAAIPLRRLVQRYAMPWEEALQRLGETYATVIQPLITHAILDGVRFSRIGELPVDPGLPTDAWVSTHSRLPPGAPDSDMLLHVWVPPDPIAKRFLLGQWLTYHMVSRVQALAQRYSVPWEMLHDVGIHIPYQNRPHQTSVAVLAMINDRTMALEGITSRRPEEQRLHFRRIADLVAPLVHDPRRTIVAVLDDPMRAALSDDAPLTIVSLRDLDHALERALG